MHLVKSLGWTVEIVHPETGRVLRPDVLDDPVVLPSLNALPEVRIPVRKSEAWLDPALEGETDMAVYLDGVKAPIDTLREVEQRTDRTILHGIGGEELRDRVQVSYRSERPSVAVENLVDTETSYSPDVDEPESGDLTNSLLQDPDTQQELESLVNPASDLPLTITNGGIEPLQTCWLGLLGDWSLPEPDLVSLESNDAFEQGAAQGLLPQDDVDNDGSPELAAIEFDFEVDYTIPTYDVSGSTLDEVWAEVRMTSKDVTTNPTLRVDIDGQVIGDITVGNDGFDEVQWERADPTDSFGELQPGTHTCRIRRIDSLDTDEIFIDCVAIYDAGQRFGSFDYTFDNTLSSPGGYLDGPETHPDVVTVEPSAADTPFAVLSANASLTIDDTSNEQRLQVSNDGGQTWLPDDGTEDNTSTVDVDFPNESPSVRLRVDLSRWSPNGARDETPRYGYAGQRIDAWELYGDLRLETLLVDRRFDNDLKTVITDIAGEDFLWSYNLDANGNPQVSFTQPGQRVADSDPDLGDVTIKKNMDVWESVTIKGASQQVSGETFQASTSFEPLNNDGIVPGSESVYDDSQSYDRGVDYEMDYTDGEIRAVDTGALTTGTEYTIDYRREISGSYTVQDASANPRELVKTVPAVTSENTAEQVAFAIATRYSEPRYTANLSIPRADVTFDPLEALTLDNLDLPAAATPLELREQPDVTPSGIEARLGSRGRIEGALSEISSTLRQVSDRA